MIGLKESGSTSTGLLAGGDGQVEIAQESADVFFDVVADRAHRVQRLPRRVWQGSIFVAFPRDDGADIAAAHGDHDIGGPTVLAGPRLGNSSVMSIPTSAIASTAAAFSSLPGADHADQATARSPARWVKNPRAIWERPALWPHKNSTVGLPSLI